ncbi:unnamed protein product [Caenorhabditis angaria]|uniref:Uncharacterized protein n=1 Tax=Caenorhabditis angaria TaxID=860376 RepID=A0A9P1MVX4_9PELO|nr:unnamed protein product [Caenorhabditis angaria]
MKNEKNDTKLEVGKLPDQYKSSGKLNTKYYLIIPALICGCLVWFAYNQWQNPPELQKTPESLLPKERVWWMPDLLKTLPALADGFRSEKYLERYNMSTCLIEGNFEKTAAAVSCYLLNPENYAKNNKSISTDTVGHGFCGNSPPLSLYSWGDWKKYLSKPMRKLVMIQQPLERFVRQFSEFCVRQKICFDCGTDVACFLRKIKKDLEKIAEGLKGNIRTPLTRVFSPQSWYCHLNHHLREYEFIKLGGNSTEKEEYINQWTTILEKQGVKENLLENIKNEINKIAMELTTDDMKLYANIRKDVDLFRLFRQVYEYDYLIFGYSLEV